MIKNLDKALNEGRKLARRHTRLNITVEHINSIAAMNNQSPHLSIMDAFAIGFLQGMKAGRKEAKRGGGGRNDKRAISN